MLENMETIYHINHISVPIPDHKGYSPISFEWSYNPYQLGL